MRLTVKKLAEATGFCKDTIRKHTDAGHIPCTKDINGWRVFNEKSLEIAKKLAGISELASSDNNASE